MRILRKYKYKIVAAATVFIAARFLAANLLPASEPNLFVEPATGSFSSGEVIPVILKLETSTRVNAVEVELIFPKDVLEIAGISREQSVVRLWIKEPEFSNETGTLSFAGIIPNGYSGIGDLLSVDFISKQAGDVRLEFSRVSILADDGKATEILNDGAGASYSIKVKTAQRQDFNQDGKITIVDVSVLAAHWGKTKNVEQYDLNGDQKIDLADLSILVSKISKE